MGHFSYFPRSPFDSGHGGPQERSPQRREDEGRRGACPVARLLQRDTHFPVDPFHSSGIPFHVGPRTPSVRLAVPPTSGPQENRAAWSRPRDRQVKPVYATLPYAKHTRWRVADGSLTESLTHQAVGRQLGIDLPSSRQRSIEFDQSAASQGDDDYRRLRVFAIRIPRDTL